MSSNSYLKPDISFSDDEDDRSLSKRKISNQIKKTQTNKDAIKHPNTFYVEDDDQDQADDSDVIISEDDEDRERQYSNRKRKSFKKGSDRSSSKKQKRIDSDEEFLPDDDESEDNDDVESVASEDLSEENISDSDYDPDREDDEADEANGPYYDEETTDTINLSSDNESPDKPHPSRVIHSNSKEFWSKVEELKTKGFSIQQAGGVNNSSKYS